MYSSTMLGKVEVGNFGDPKIHFPKTGYLWIYIPRKMIRNKFEAPKYKTSIHQGIYYSRFVTRSSPPFISTDTPFSLPQEFHNTKRTSNSSWKVRQTQMPLYSTWVRISPQGETAKAKEAPVACHWGLQTLIALHVFSVPRGTMIVGDLEGKFFQETAAMRDIPMFETQKNKCERNTSTHSYR